MEKRANILRLATKISLESLTYTGITYSDPEYRILAPIVDDDECDVMMHMRLEADRTLEDLAYVSRIWRIFDEQGMDDAKFVPYWRENLSRTDGVKCSLYRGKKTTAVVTNLSRGKKEAKLIVPEGTTAVRELLSGRTYPVVDGAVTLPAEPFALYILAFDALVPERHFVRGRVRGDVRRSHRHGF